MHAGYCMSLLMTVIPFFLSCFGLNMRRTGFRWTQDGRPGFFSLSVFLSLALLNVFNACAADNQPATDKAPVLVGIDAEFGLKGSTSAQAIELGASVAVAEINAAGGVLNGRPLKLVLRDNRSIPARGVQNMKELAALPDLVAVMGGRFSPVVLDQLPVIESMRLPFLALWSSADQIIANRMKPNYVFRLSLRDSLAMPYMLEQSAARGYKRVGILLNNTAWGRSNLAAAKEYAKTGRAPKIVRSSWYSWVEKTLIDKYNNLVDSGAEAIILVSNDEAAILVREMAALPASRRVPLIAHWGLTGGEFFEQAGSALQKVDLSILQTFNFFSADSARVARFMQGATLMSKGNAQNPPPLLVEDIKSPAGVAHAYDATHILARAINLAGSTDRSRIRAALEKIPLHRGLVKDYAPPFTPFNHEALGKSELMMTRFRADGVLIP